MNDPELAEAIRVSLAEAAATSASNEVSVDAGTEGTPATREE